MDDDITENELLEELAREYERGREIIQPGDITIGAFAARLNISSKSAARLLNEHVRSGRLVTLMVERAQDDARLTRVYRVP